MKITGEWRDDHLPCVSFEHNGTNFMICWTDAALIGKLQLVEDGDVTIETALKREQILLSIINDPFNVVDSENCERIDERDIDGDLVYSTDLGHITINPKE
jgi:hypothetical protein